jgi:hypothetical protein
MTAPVRGNDVGARKGLAMGCVEPVVTLSTSSASAALYQLAQLRWALHLQAGNVELLEQLRAA